MLQQRDGTEAGQTPPFLGLNGVRCHLPLPGSFPLDSERSVRRAVQR
jgi:hypothetical protein